MGWGIYVHIPFCRRKCFYCDFPSYAGREDAMERYAHALCREIEIAAQGITCPPPRGRGTEFVSIYDIRYTCPPPWGRGTIADGGGGRTLLPSGRGKASTVYVGGGTPTALPQPLLMGILHTLKEKMPIREDAEWTVEVNPGTVDRAYLEGLFSCGVTRLSFGVQSFSDTLLRRIGRIHTAQQAREALRLARDAGFRNLSLDLIYGLPGQTMQDLRESVAEAAALGAEHISIYGLQIEEGTVFARQQEQGRLELPHEDLVDAMYDDITEELPRRGYLRYEISNFAKPGYESRHNLGYWQDVPYLGLGAAAHSYWQGERRANPAALDAYMEAIESGTRPAALEEPATREIRMEEFCFLALRTAKGIEKAAFREKFGCTIESIYQDGIARMKEKGLLAEENGYLHLTALGMKYGNWVFGEFLL